MVQIGKLGEYNFPVGKYAYVGSAMNGLDARVHRHLSNDKKMHWHIDHLLRYAHNKEAFLIHSDIDIECKINSIVGSLPGSKALVKGFGSSDCDCFAHLYLLSGEGYSQIRLSYGVQIEEGDSASTHKR